MSTTTIWESASRPLFIRTVWLESDDIKRRFQRHYILDYNLANSFKKTDSISTKTINYKQKVSTKKLGKI